MTMTDLEAAIRRIILESPIAGKIVRAELVRLQREVKDLREKIEDWTKTGGTHG